MNKTFIGQFCENTDDMYNDKKLLLLDQSKIQHPKQPAIKPKAADCDIFACLYIYMNIEHAA